MHYSDEYALVFTLGALIYQEWVWYKRFIITYSCDFSEWIANVQYM